jgi:uncharacterized protein YjbI with pentapeptide repeats
MAHFAAIMLPERVDCRGATFSEDTQFGGFSKDVDFAEATFSEGAFFHEALFGGQASFSRATFTKRTLFNQAIFSKGASFIDAMFSQEVWFVDATFSREATIGENASFVRATFGGGADFQRATFTKGADFAEATFTKGANFTATTFGERADFHEATFNEGADFRGATFNEGADFYGATFSGRTIFAGPSRDAWAGHIFADPEVDFRYVDIASPDAMTFVEIALTKFRFQDTDLRKVLFIGVKWPQKDGRVRVYDDIASVETEVRGRRPWTQIERLYRELKQNYEDRRDYERAGDFHYGEKEIRRQNPDTAWGLRFFLTLYWLFSGYGERYFKPLVWAGLLFVGSTIGYMLWGLRSKAGGSQLAWTNGWDWLQGAYYSFRGMTFLKPDDWAPVGYAHAVNTFQTLLSPLFLGLFALALRQRLKR